MEGGISRVRLCKGATLINHLLFAYDSVQVFWKTDLGENRRVQQLLEQYELAFGQKIKQRKNFNSF